MKNRPNVSKNSEGKKSLDNSYSKKTSDVEIDLPFDVTSSATKTSSSVSQKRAPQKKKQS